MLGNDFFLFECPNWAHPRGHQRQNGSPTLFGSSVNFGQISVFIKWIRYTAPPFFKKSPIFFSYSSKVVGDPFYPWWGLVTYFTHSSLEFSIHQCLRSRFLLIQNLVSTMDFVKKSGRRRFIAFVSKVLRGNYADKVSWFILSFQSNDLESGQGGIKLTRMKRHTGYTRDWTKSSLSVH